jgi:hypothetical protein
MKITDVPRLTIGIEEEFQIVDAQGQLKSHIETLLTAAAGRYGDQIKREMMQSVVEAGTKICADISGARSLRCCGRRVSASRRPAPTRSRTGKTRRSPSMSATRSSKRSFRTSSASS